MTYAQNLWLFFILVLGIIIVPGMDMFFVIANALTGGRARGIAATAGVMLGGIFHTVFAAICVGVLTTLPGMVFTLILLGGAAYMAWIGWTLVRSSITVSSLGAAGTASLRQAFMQGFVTCVLNPHGLHVHARRLSAIHAAAIWASVAAGHPQGADHHRNTRHDLWRTGTGGGQEPGFPDGPPCGDHLDRQDCGSAVAGRCGDNVGTCLSGTVIISSNS
jgi:threonine/homoserine/homoserine lactone efflux protein